MFLCALIEKKRWTPQSIQNSKFQFSFLFISAVISFTIFQILLFSFTLKPFIYFLHIWERKQPLKAEIHGHFNMIFQNDHITINRCLWNHDHFKMIILKREQMFLNLKGEITIEYSKKIQNLLLSSISKKQRCI